MPNNLHEWLQVFPSFLALVFTGIVVKQLDDYIDLDSTFTTTPSEGGIVYALVFILLAAVFDVSLTFALFSACYIVGMFPDMTRILPSKMPGWAESLILFGIVILFCGLELACWALMIIFAIQILDDLLDYYEDMINNQHNFFISIGIERSIILFILCLYLSLLLQPLLSVLVLLISLSISVLSKQVSRRSNQC